MTKKLKSKNTRKTSKKTTKRKPVKQRKTQTKNIVSGNMAMAMVPYAEINQVETYKGKMSIVPTPFTENQIMQLIRPTPSNVILKKPGKGGGTFNYIPGWWFKKKLNFVFGWMHDFEILGERIDGDFVTVKGKLTIKNAKGQPMVSKMDFGGHPIQMKKNGGGYLDISNDFKAAATDCLKRCAVQLGIGLDVYSGGDYTNPNQPEAPLDGPVQIIQEQPQTAKSEAKRPVIDAAPVAVQVDHVKRLSDHLAHKAGTTPAQKEAYIKKVLGPANCEKYKLLMKKGLGQQHAQQILGSVLKAEAEGR